VVVQRLKTTFASLQIRNYRIYFLAQAVSTNGSWMQRVAQFWLVLHLTGSGVALGLTAAFQSLPVLLFGTVGGLVADRVDKRLLLMVTQASSGVLGLVLAGITLTGVVQLWMVYVLALCLGIINIYDTPARQSFVTEMVGPGQVANAVGLNSAVFTSSRMIGPAIAGVLISAVGTGWCFLYNGLSFFAVVAALRLMRPSELHRPPPVRRSRGQIREGLRYTWDRPKLRIPLVLLIASGTFAFNWNVVLPLMARYTFHSGAETFGAMLSMIGVGAFAGALFAAGRTVPTYRLFVYAALIFSATMLGAAVAPTLALVMVALIPMGMAMTTFQVTGNSLLQLNTNPAFRGRVMSLYVLAFMGTTPIGSPIVGWVSQQFGARTGLALGAIVTLGAAAVALPWLHRFDAIHVDRESGAPRGDLVNPTVHPIRIAALPQARPFVRPK
jgi:MFS family permease